MLVIRFLRIGKKNQPFFRIVVTDKKNPPRGGKFLEILGFFNPLTKEKKLKEERIKYWLGVGAQTSARVYNLLIQEKIIEGKKIDVHKKSKKVKEEKKPPASAPASAETPTDKEATADKEEKPKEEPKKEEKTNPPAGGEKKEEEKETKEQAKKEEKSESTTTEEEKEKQ